MASAARRILVVGGNGFIGSAICKAALARGFQVTSVSSSGKPYRTAKGHTPTWTSKVEWQKGDALHPQTFEHLFPEVSGVVHTLGTLIEDGKYKQAIKEGDVPALLGTFFRMALGGDHSNPLEKSADRTTSYEAMNRDSALRVCEAFLSSSPNETQNAARPFVYLSAEDIFRPFIPARYIETKREAEQGIEAMMTVNRGYRGVYIRPGLVYHAYHRPLTTLPAILLDVSATIHSSMPHSLPTPSSVLRTLGAALPGATLQSRSSLESVANALATPPVHVDQVAAAVCRVLDLSSPIRGIIGVRRMLELIGHSKSRGGEPAVGISI